MFSKYCSILVLSCSLSLWWVGGWVGWFFSDYHVSPNFLLCWGWVVVEVGLGCDNRRDCLKLYTFWIANNQCQKKSILVLNLRIFTNSELFWEQGFVRRYQFKTKDISPCNFLKTIVMSSLLPSLKNRKSVVEVSCLAYY